MSEEEWNKANPHQSSALVEAWMQKQKREANNRADLMLVIAKSAGNKKIKHGDFLPNFAKPKKRTPDEIEKQLKAGLMAMAQRSKQNGKK